MSRGQHARKWGREPVIAIDRRSSVGPPVQEPHPVDPEAALGQIGGAHVRAGEPLVAGIRGAHVRADDPLVRRIFGVHVRADDPLAAEAPNTGVGADETVEVVARSSRSGRRHWHVVPVVGTLGALVAGLAAGGAYAYFASTGSGAGQNMVGSPVSVTVTAESGPAALLPGGTGGLSFSLHNPNPFGATFTQVLTVGTPVSGNTVACPSSNLSVVGSSPSTLSQAITVGAGATSGTESMADFVRLAAGAPNACQGVTFTVTFTLSGHSS